MEPKLNIKNETKISDSLGMSTGRTKELEALILSVIKSENEDKTTDFSLIYDYVNNVEEFIFSIYYYAIYYDRTRRV